MLTLSGCSLFDRSANRPLPPDERRPPPFVTYDPLRSGGSETENADSALDGVSGGDGESDVPFLVRTPTAVTVQIEFVRCGDDGRPVYAFAGVPIETVRDWLDGADSHIYRTLLSDLEGATCAEAAQRAQDVERAIRRRIESGAASAQ